MTSSALVTGPVLIFFIVLVIILMAPLLLNRLKIPHIIGMIVAGVIVGPYGLHVLDNDASFKIFGQVGLLYLMFLAGIEIDMLNLKRNLNRGLVFGLLTFFIPLILGIVASMTLLGCDAVTSVLLASMYASHTLIAYPVATRFGITKTPVVLIAIVGTIVAVIGALLALALSINVVHTGEFSLLQLAWLLCKLAVYCAAVNYGYQWLTRIFFRHFTDRVTQYVYVLALVFLAAWAAQAIGLESVLGAFLAGLVLNQFVPNTSPLMSRIEFVGNALFIPYFLIGVGMMIDLRVVFNSTTLLIAANMLAVALISKWIAALIAQKMFRMTADDRGVLFGLTTAHTAVALAVVTIGHEMGLMTEQMLNGTILLILITCAIAPMATSGAAGRIKLRMLQDEEGAADDSVWSSSTPNTLVPVDNPVTSMALMDLALMIHPSERQGSTMFAVNVRTDNTTAARNNCRASLDLAMNAAASVDVPITAIERFDSDVVSGLLNIINERDITCVVMGLHRKVSIIDSFFGAKLERLVRETPKMVLVNRTFNPINTLRRVVVVVPRKAEYESGFAAWVTTTGRIARSLGSRIIYLCAPQTRAIIAGVLRHERLEVRSEFRNMEEWDDFVLLSNRITDDDLLCVVTARPGSLSHSPDTAEMPTFLQNYFSRSNMLIIYPEQSNGKNRDVMSFIDPTGADVDTQPSIFRRVAARLSAYRRRNRPQRTSSPDL